MSGIVEDTEFSASQGLDSLKNTPDLSSPSASSWIYSKSLSPMDENGAGSIEKVSGVQATDAGVDRTAWPLTRSERMREQSFKDCEILVDAMTEREMYWISKDSYDLIGKSPEAVEDHQVQLEDDRESERGVGGEDFQDPQPWSRLVFRRKKSNSSRVLAPPALPVQERLCWLWIEQRLNIELDPDRSLFDALINGAVLCLLIGENPRATGDDSVAPQMQYERNIEQFLRGARRRGIKPADLFEVEDILMMRNVPAVLRTIAAVAHHIDAANFSHISEQLPNSKTQWRADEEPDEVWTGDSLISQIASMLKKITSRSRLGITVSGLSGSGKSATINNIMGRNALPSTHNVSFIGKDEDYTILYKEERREMRKAAVAGWPTATPRSRPPYACGSVEKSFVKSSGVMIRVSELPSMEQAIRHVGPDGLFMFTSTGDASEVRKAMRGEEADLVLLTERLNDFRVDCLKHAYDMLMRLYGRQVWKRTILVFTHGSSAPPKGMTFDQHVERKTRAAQKYIRRISRIPDLVVPVIVVENSKSAERRMATGGYAADSTSFEEKLLAAIKHILETSRRNAPIRVRRGIERWQYAALGVALVFLISQI